MGPKRVQGLIVRFTGLEVWVDVEGELVPCLLRGRFRQKSKSLQPVAGDRVEVGLPAAAGSPGTIEGLLPRKSWLSRYAGGRDATERVIVANIDRLITVASVRAPRLHFGFLDRVLVSAERGHNEVFICINKVDLIRRDDELSAFTEVYRAIGYPVIHTSAATGEGVDQIRALIGGGVYALVGQSGVGKSSLLNRIDPRLELKVRRVARKTGRGRHTTTYSQLFPIDDGYVADTPGMQTFGFPGQDKEDLSACFPEFRALREHCRFQPCTHSHEPGCAVKKAVDGGQVFPSRYKSYQEMLAEVERRASKRY